MAAEVYAKECIEWWKSQIGYKSGKSKSSKYSQQLDSTKPQWYNTKKNGYSDWCTIFYDAAINACAHSGSINEQRAVVCEPSVDNCGAGCVQKVNYYKSKGRWVTKHSDAQSGDQIFFRDDKYVKKENPLGVYHTGAVIDWDSKGFYTSEGNTNGCGEVSKRFYPYGDKRIAGFGHPDWSGWLPDNKPEPEPEPEPTPEPPKPTEEKYKVKTVTGAPLALRSSPSTSSGSVLEWMPSGSEITVSEFVTGQNVYGSTSWAHAKYKGKTGYCTATRIKKA